MASMEPEVSLLQPFGYSLFPVFGSIPGSSCVAVTSCITSFTLVLINCNMERNNSVFLVGLTKD